MDWISIFAGAMTGFVEILVFMWLRSKRNSANNYEPKLYCSLCWRSGSYQDIYDHARLDHGLWYSLTAEAYPDLMRLGAHVAAPLNKNGEVYREEVWTNEAVEKAVLLLSPPMLKSLSKMTPDDFEHLTRIYR